MNKLYLFYSSKQMKNWRFFSGVQVLNSESREPCNCIIRAYLERLGKEPNFWQYFGRITNVMSFKLRIFELESFDLAFQIPYLFPSFIKKIYRKKDSSSFPLAMINADKIIYCFNCTGKITNDDKLIYFSMWLIKHSARY